MLANALRLALRAIRRNPLRSSLTVLGIVIGVAAVITMVDLGRGATARVSAQIASLGSNLLMVRPGQRLGPGRRAEAPPFDLADAEAIAREIGGVAAVAPSAAQGSIAIYGNQNWSTSVIGTTNEYFPVRNWTFAAGRPFTNSELRAGRAVCILGATVARELFGAQDPIDDRIRLKKLACEVVGVLASKGQTAMGSDQDDLVVVPLRMFWRRIAGNQDVDFIQLSARDGADTAKVKRDIEALMRERRRIGPNEEDDFSVRDMQEITAALTGTTQVLTALLGAVAAVSLLVGGIGIMNIMLVSVTERTHEIGIRKALGAKRRAILLQFLLEAVVLCNIGGVLGVAAGFGLGNLVTAFTEFAVHVPSEWAVRGIAFCTAVGILFGMWPAVRASRLVPVEALRYE